MAAHPREPNVEPASGGAGDASLLKIVELLGSIAAPVTVITALLYYFGWVRENAVFGYFGVDSALLAFDLPQYLTRSAGTAFKPLVILLVVAALVLLVGRAADAADRHWPSVVKVVRRRKWTLRPVPSSLVIVGLLAASLGVATAVSWVTCSPAWAALSLACGSLAAWHGLRRLAVPVGAARHTPLVERALLFGIVATALFWATAVYSQQVGSQLAASTDGNPTALPEVTVHSVDELNLGTDPGAADPGKFAHVYHGLRVLIYANERWFLLTGDLTPAGRHKLAVVRDDDTVRIDLLK